MAKRRKQAKRGVAPSKGLAPILLAAGASRRLGECKALVDLDGSTPLARLAAGAANAVDPAATSRPPATLVIAGPHAEEIAAELPEGCELLHNPDANSGRTGGLILAVARRAGFDLLVVPVDVPRVPELVFRNLAEAWRAQGSPPMGWMAPRYQGRFGHPILIGNALARRLGGFPPDKPLSELRALADPLLSLECDSPEILEDLDTPGDLANLRALLGDTRNSDSRESE